MLEPTNQRTDGDLQNGWTEAGRETETEVPCDAAAGVPRTLRDEAPSGVGAVKEAEQPALRSVASLPPNESEIERTSLHDGGAASLDTSSTREQQTAAGRHQHDPSGILFDLPSVDRASYDDQGDGEKKPPASLGNASRSPPTSKDEEECRDNESYSSDNDEAPLSTDDVVKQQLKQANLGGNCQADELPDFKAQVRGEMMAGSTKPSRPGQAASVKNTTTSKNRGPDFKDQVVHREPGRRGSARPQQTQAAPHQDGGPDFKGQSDSRSEIEDIALSPTSLHSDTIRPAAPAATPRRAPSAQRPTTTASSSDPTSCVHAVLVEEESMLWADASPMEENQNQMTRRKRVCICVVVALAFVGLALGLIFGLEQTTEESGSTNSTNGDAAAVNLTQYNCSLPGLETLEPGKYAGVQANYLSFATFISSPNFPVRAQEFEACTGGKIEFSDANNIWEDPLRDLGSKTSRGSELYDGYLMSYSHFPEVSALGLAEHLNERIRRDNNRLKWEDVLPKVKTMGTYRKDGVTNIDFLMYDGDFFVPVIRLDLLEKFNFSLPNTWDETVELAKFFHGTDLNDDGEKDFGFCHFPRTGEGFWDSWFPEFLYSTWASMDQTQGISEGFFFDSQTMEPRLGAGFSRAATIWRDLWNYGNGTTEFITGRCAIGFGPPGEWKPSFLNQVSRRDANGFYVWRPTMKNGDYAEPYRFRPFGSLKVVDHRTGELTPCTEELCPKAEIVPPHGHHGDSDRASILPASPIAGQLINRAPFYWSGGLGTLIRASAAEIKKDLLWDFFLYTNSPETSVNDVASYVSWLDSWRTSQLEPGDNFLQAGWSRQAYEEHKSTQEWALSEEVNGALNLRIPGVFKYTSDVVLEHLKKFMEGNSTLGDFVRETEKGWNEVTEEQGKLEQLEIYRSALGLDSLSDVELCRLHHDLVTDKDPSKCAFVSQESNSTNIMMMVLLSILVPALTVIILIQLYCNHKRNKDVTRTVATDTNDSV